MLINEDLSKGVGAVRQVSATEFYMGYRKPGIAKTAIGWNICRVKQDGDGDWLYQWAYSLGGKLDFLHKFSDCQTYSYK